MSQITKISIWDLLCQTENVIPALLFSCSCRFLSSSFRAGMEFPSWSWTGHSRNSCTSSLSRSSSTSLWRLVSCSRELKEPERSCISSLTCRSLFSRPRTTAWTAITDLFSWDRLWSRLLVLVCSKSSDFFTWRQTGRFNVFRVLLLSCVDTDISEMSTVDKTSKLLPGTDTETKEMAGTFFSL